MQNTYYYTVKTSLGGWDVNGKVYKPGETIVVSGNCIVKPIYDEVRTLQQRVEETKVVDGSLIANYIAERTVTLTVSDGEVSGKSGTWCAGKKCNTYSNAAMGSESAAKSAADSYEPPAPGGYTKGAETVSAGTVVTTPSAGWQQNGPTGNTGTTTTTRITYDANGNELSRTESTN